MRETDGDLARMQELLDDSYARAGRHLASIHTPDRRLSAGQVADRLRGMCLLALATATAEGRPIVGPVDGILYRGELFFGSAPDSLRFRHIRRRPAVSATHLPGEELAVTVHGRAVPIDIREYDDGGFRETLLEIYLPRYGPEWESFLESGPVYARIEPQRMFAFALPS